MRLRTCPEIQSPSLDVALGLLLPYILSIVGSKFCTQPGNSLLDPQQVTEKIEDVYMYICVRWRTCVLGVCI